MKLAHEHSWQVTPKEAILIQNRLRDKVIREDRLSRIKLVAGVDIGFEDKGKVTRAAIVVLEYPALELQQVKIHRCNTEFPYVPGLLSFREIPAAIKAINKLKQLPELLICDGQGYAHPRRFGLASHLGVLTNIPSIGVAKTKLIGTYNEPENVRGAFSYLMDKDEIIGVVLRTRVDVKPVYISIGHRISLQSAIRYVMDCTLRYRLPETTRMAHKYASGLV